MRRGAIRPGVRPGGARSCAVDVIAPTTIAVMTDRLCGKSTVTETALTREVEAFGLIRRGMSGEWVEQSWGVAVSVNRAAVSSTTSRWHEPSACAGATASTFVSTGDAGPHSEPQASIDRGDAKSAVTSASAAEVRSRIVLSNVTQDPQKAFTTPS